MLPVRRRLRKQTDFDRVYKRGRVARDRLFMMRAAKPGTGISRFAVVVSTKVSKKAVDRNRVRRRAHAALGRIMVDEPKIADVVINMHSDAVRATVDDLEAAFRKAMTHLKLLS